MNTLELSRNGIPSNEIGEKLLTVIAFFVSTFGALLLYVLVEYGVLRPYQQWSRFFEKADKVFDAMLEHYAHEEE